MIPDVPCSEGAAATEPPAFDAGAWLRAGRRSRRVSQRELAALAGVPHATVSRAESGAHTPRLPTFVALLDALDYRLVAVSATDGPLQLDAEHDAVADRAGRHFPAHLEWGRTPEDGEGHGWWGWYRIAWPFVRQQVPDHTYWRRRRERR